MPEIAALSVAVTGDTSNLDQALGRANQSVSSFGSGLSSVLSGIGAGIGMRLFDGLVATLTAAGDAAIGFNAKLEQSSIAFTSMLGSGEKAQAFLQELQQFAKSTPFEYEGVEDAAKQMLAYGVSAKDVIPMLKDVGNVSAAMGQGSSGVDRITKALGQMSAATVVQRGELNQLTEMGVPAYEILGDAVGKSGQELNKLIESGKISSKVFIEAFREWSRTRFGDLMAQQSRTFNGALSNIGDAVKFATANAFKPLFTLLSEGAVAVGDFLNSDSFTSWADSAAAGMQSFADAIRAGLQVAQEAWQTWIQPAVQTVAGWFDILQSQGLAPFLAAIGQWIVQAGPQLAQQFAVWAESAVSWVERALPELGAGILSLVQGVTSWVTQNAPVIAQALQAWGVAFVSWVQTAGPGLLARLGAALSDFMTWVANAAGVWASSLLTWATAFVSWVTPMIPQVLMSLGGLITGIVSWIGQNSGVILAAVVQWAQTFWAWVQPAIPPLLAALGNLLSQLGTWIVSTALPAIVGQVAQWAQAFASWVAQATPLLLGAAGQLLSALTGWITSTALPAIKTAVQGWATEFVAWAGPAAEQLKQQLITDSQSLWAEITRIYVEARTNINSEMAAKQQEWATGHRVSLETVRQDATTLLGGYLQFQGQWNQQMIALFQSGWDAVVTIHQAFWDDLTTEFPKRVEQYISGLTSHWNDLMKGYERAFDFVKRVHVAFWDGLVSGIRAGVASYTSYINSLISAIDRLINRIRSIPALGGGGLGSMLQFRAAGGPVHSGRPYVVGERGPELMVPRQSGDILDHVTTAGLFGGGGGGTTIVNLNVYGHAVATKRELANLVVQGLREAQKDNRLRGPIV